MKTSKQELLRKAQIEKFRPEILEKVWLLFEILEEINKHPFLQNRLALKGGTALNLFYFKVPRLSVDIDLNYIGSIERSKMLLERPMIEKALEAVFSKVGLYTIRVPKKHAGGKWQLKYPSHLSGQGNLEIDLNYMFRLPICELEKKDSQLVGNHQVKNILLVNYQEIVAGKLTALFARQASRDLFDAYNLLLSDNLNFNQLRMLLCVYGAMSSIDFRTVSLDNIAFERKELSQKLIPVLRIDQQQWENNISSFVESCREKLGNILPFIDQERKFLDFLYEEGKIDASLLTQDPDLIERIQNQPLLKWKSLLSLKNQPVS
jgi:predicted nucleotidyltransferase component of viral defense system